MKKLEIIIESIELNNVLKKIKACKIEGFTVIKDVIGNSHSFSRMESDLTDVMKNAMIIIVDEEEKLDKLIDKVKVILQDYSGIMFLSDVEVIN